METCAIKGTRTRQALCVVAEVVGGVSLSLFLLCHGVVRLADARKPTPPQRSCMCLRLLPCVCVCVCVFLCVHMQRAHLHTRVACRSLSAAQLDLTLMLRSMILPKALMCGRVRCDAMGVYLL